MKLIFCSSILLALLHYAPICYSQNVVEQHGQLKVQGNKIVNKDNTPVQLKGMSLFWSQWVGKYYNYSTIKWLKDDWHCTIVRAALAVEHGGYLENPVAEEQKIDSVVEAAIKLGIYVIVDWHDHNAQRHRTQAQNFFVAMAKKYGHYPNIIYEIYNEPLNTTSWADSIKPYSIAVIDSIRMYDPDNIIVCGTRSWAQDVDEASMDPINRSNIAYALHYYAGTHKRWLRDKATVALNNGIALFVTEFGTCKYTGNGPIDYKETNLWWDFLEQHKISWCNWVIADKNETSSVLSPDASEKGGWDIEKVVKPSGQLVRKKLRGED